MSDYACGSSGPGLRGLTESSNRMFPIGSLRVRVVDTPGNVILAET